MAGRSSPSPTSHSFFARATGQEPFKVPESWLAAKGQLDLTTKFNLSTNSDIVGGNSGSPLLDAQGRLVGLMFDGNIHSIAGSYWFDPGVESLGCGASGDHARGPAQGVQGRRAVGGDGA